ncbi:hypothetical protein BpHYR1_050116 [Brachionus plicatilis]|uniref:Uncharacterized protein n=1 Tax=Brachionus plicatilis TaxID=10195 RepID=A0A3M7RCM3_BRAPC|nr:hypothetical protein BpHYR1_050116 [Brachionus plicatilis]
MRDFERKQSRCMEPIWLKAIKPLDHQQDRKECKRLHNCDSIALLTSNLNDSPFNVRLKNSNILRTIDSMAYKGLLAIN